MEYNLLLSLFILITWIVPALFCGRRPTVLVCPDLRGLPGCGLSVLKLGKPWANADELITKPVGALPIGSRVCWVRFWAFCVYILTFRCHKMFQAHLTLTLTRLQVTCISLRRPGTRAFGVLGYTTPWELEQMELIQLLYRPHSSSASAPIPWLFSLPGPLGRHLPSILSFSMKTDFPSTPQSWPPPPCLHWAVENASPFPSSSLLLTGSPSRKGPRFISDSSVLHTGLELGAVQWLDLVIPSHGAAG